MIINYFEHQLIKNNKLPEEWQSQAALDELLGFLQSNWEQRAIFYDDSKITSRQQFLEFTGQKQVRTKDYVGTIVFKGQQLNIFPKVFKTERDDWDTDELELSHLMHNLVRWIEYTTKIDYPYISISADVSNTDNLQDLFISLYVRYVKAALDRGLYFRYETQNEDISSIRGRVNIRDYYTKKFPNGILDKFNCEYSTFEFDNLLNRVIKCTLKYIFNLTNARNQKIIRNLLNKLGEVSDVRCTPNDCDRIQLSKMNNNYRIILSMSKMFLLNKSTTYNIDTQESFCFLFPMDILFEGFIGGYMQSILKGEAKVRLQASEVSLVDNIRIGDRQFDKAFEMRHDILVEHKEKGVFILDTKYKEISRFDTMEDAKQQLAQEVSSGDLYQVINYAVSRGLDKVYLLYPQYRLENVEPYPVRMDKKVKQDGVTYNIEINLVRLPFVFEEDDERVKENLKSELLKIFE